MAQFPRSIETERSKLRALQAEAPSRPGMLTAYEQCKPLERIFVKAYVATDDPVKSVIETDKTLKGNSLANVRALDYMRRPLVQAAIAEEQRKLAERFDITADMVIREIALVAFARMGDFATKSEDGNYLELDLNKIPEAELSDRLAAVSEFQLDETTDKDDNVTRKFRFKLHSKMDGLDKLMKRFGLYAPENVNMVHSGPNGGPIQNVTLSVTATAAEAADLYRRTLEG